MTSQGKKIDIGANRNTPTNHPLGSTLSAPATPMVNNNNNNNSNSNNATNEFVQTQPQQGFSQSTGSMPRSQSYNFLAQNAASNVNPIPQQQQAATGFGTLEPSRRNPSLQHLNSSLNSSTGDMNSFINTSLNQSTSSSTSSYYSPTTAPYTNPATLTGDEATLKRLMKVGNWNNVFKVADLCIANTNNPLSILEFKLCRIISHVKMRSYKIAYDEIQGIGDNRDLVNCFETYPHLFPGRKGTMVPFSMRIIKAELACHLGLEKFQLDALYALLSLTKREIQNLDDLLKNSKANSKQNSSSSNNSNNSNSNSSIDTTTTQDKSQIYLSQLEATTAASLLTPNTASPKLPPQSNTTPNATITSPIAAAAPLLLSPLNTNSNNINEDVFESIGNDNSNESLLAIWKARERRITFSIVTFIIQKNRDFLLAIKILEDFMTRQGPDFYTLSAIGRLHLQMGNLKGGERVLLVADKLMNNSNNNAAECNLVSLMNKGFLSIANDQYPKAIEYFDKIIEIENSGGNINITAINNKCISMLYTCDLGGAITQLESLLQTEKEKSIDEILIFNICSLYELATDRSNEKKKAILADIAKRAPDNFDFKVFKISNTPSLS
ncbi:hypothetical protein CYY_007641 [Polysphondylium violaceum]|uniref:Uncharacterized protein n=1 Tax=Polysphondylium violaceum TaxID=133409 RepID=A0A8J4PP12_9MYCE|nr:hypothetical protein CYY_007641 [Polysphondylium violaceum]